MSQPYVVVVGGGVLGASVAAALARSSARVTLLDAAIPASGASTMSFAWTNAHKKKPESYFRLNAEGVEQYHRLAEQGADWFHPVGNLEVATDPSSSEALEALVADLAGRGYPARRISAAEAAELEPAVDPDRITDAAFFEREGWVDTERMVIDMLAELRAAGGEVRTHTSVEGFESVGGRTKVRLVGGEELTADYVVCGVGADTQRLLAGSGVTVRLIEEGDVVEKAPGDRRYSAVGGLADTTALRAPLRRVLHTPNMGLRPSASGRAVLAGDGAGSRVPRGDQEIFTTGPMLLERARKTFPVFEDVQLDRVRMGVRPLPADGRTVAGFTEAVPGLYVTVTHSGVTVAQHLARLIASEVLDQEEREELADFRPSRFES